MWALDDPNNDLLGIHEIEHNANMQQSRRLGYRAAVCYSELLQFI